MRRWMWIIAGPNGAGKSTLTSQIIKQSSFRNLVTLNADERTAALRKIHPTAPQSDLNLRAAKDIDAEVARLIGAGDSFLVETVLSSGKYRDDVRAARAAGFKIGLIYVSLHPPELCPLRVSERVMKGGHTVEPAKALARYKRSHAQLTWFAAQVDALLVYDNSAEDGSPVLIATRDGNEAPVVFAIPGRNPAVDEALQRHTSRGASKRAR